MTENEFQTQYDVTKKTKIRIFYESNKILIFSSALILLISILSFSFYLDSIEKKKIKLSDNYVQAKIYLANGEKDKAVSILKKTIFEDDPTYSVLCFFLILNQNLISDHKEISALYDHLLENNSFESEIRNLLIYKKSLFSSNSVDETELLEITKPLLSTETLWKPHALLLLGDYFMSKGENIKAREFYQQILSMNNLHKNLYDQAKLQLANINHE